MWCRGHQICTVDVIKFQGFTVISAKEAGMALTDLSTVPPRLWARYVAIDFYTIDSLKAAGLIEFKGSHPTW